MASNSIPSNSPPGFSSVLHKSPFTIITSATTQQPLTTVLIGKTNNIEFKGYRLSQKQQKEEALSFRVAKTSEVTQIEKELGAEINELEKQRDKLESELKKVNNLLAVANGRLQNDTEEREHFDYANNQLLVHFKSKVGMSWSRYNLRVEADTCNAFVEFLEAAWDFQYSFMEEKEKKVNDELETHEEYFINVARGLLSAYKHEKAIDPHEEFLQDNEQRKSLEHAYLAAKTKDAEEKKTSFNPRPYYLRLFIDWLLDLSTLDPVFEGANFQLLTALATSFHTLQPLKVPAFRNPDLKFHNIPTIKTALHHREPPTHCNINRTGDSF
ncbi:unnamed protein product [Lactuca virosa]|uniref:Uncharacterized protein n=1 Tax=Lactuca virosa TaxID=75947 RepID=A0AAU9M297_9ASTR|nr:unnamed protein product [Lactuca virosa]